MANNYFREELRIKYLKLLAANEEIEAFVEYFAESESYINQVVSNQIQTSASTLKDLIEIIKFRKGITLNQKI